VFAIDLFAVIVEQFANLLSLPAYYAMQGQCNGQMSVCLSVRLIDSRGDVSLHGLLLSYGAGG